MFAIELAVPFGPAPVPARPRHRLRAPRPAAGAGRADRQLRLLQSPDGGALPVAPRRRDHRAHPAGPRGAPSRPGAPAGRTAALAARGAGGHRHDDGDPERLHVRARDPAAGSDAGVVGGHVRVDRAVPLGEWLRAVPDDDDRAPRDRHRGQRRRRTWIEYPFPWKAGDPRRAPGFVQPHMPRLDWQMWFAALGPRAEAHWLLPLASHLLNPSPAVLALLNHNSFAGAPPRFDRLALYDYLPTYLPSAARAPDVRCWTVMSRRSSEFVS